MKYIVFHSKRIDRKRQRRPGICATDLSFTTSPWVVISVSTPFGHSKEMFTELNNC